LVAAPPVFPSQYCVPCVQNLGPQGKVPVGGVQPPRSEMSVPAAAAMQVLL
jgi:hypothetical protein